MGPLVRNAPAYQVGSQWRHLRVVSGQLQRPVLLEPEHPNAVHASIRVCEPQLHEPDASQLSLARPVELDDLLGAAGGGPDPELRAERILSGLSARSTGAAIDL